MAVEGQDNDPQPEGSKERLDGMRRLAERVKLSEFTDRTKTRPVALRTEPLHRYGDRARGILDGTIWAWGERGRPIAILKVELWPDRDDGRGRWSFGISTTGPALVSTEFFDGLTWSSSEPGIELRAVPDAPRPADSPGARLAQAKAISRRLSAHAEHPRVPGGIELRLLPTPILRYADPDTGLLDGVMFAFVSTTNPETLVFIEAWDRGERSSAWRYGFARQGTSGVTVSDDRKVTWTIPYAPPPSNTATYMNRSLPKGIESQ